jgi:UDP-N-acetylmuramoyl-tripeptide--D-alanyl-D-alanine ligase
VHATRGNLNNLIGVPLTILAAPDDAEALVVEAGASVPGELARLREIIAPTIGVVTNVSLGHLAGFGSIEGVLAEKTSLLTNVPLAVVGTEPPALAVLARRAARRLVTVGLRAGAEVRPERWSLDPDGRPSLTFRGQGVAVPLIGAHQAVNAMFALAIAAELNLDLAAVAAALGQVKLPPGRGEVLHAGRLTVINDAYNANPGSLAAALETVQAMRGARRVVILVGSMLELGSEAAAQHERMADAIVALGPDLVGAVGEFATAFERRRAALGDRLVTAPDAETLGRAVRPRLQGDELVLVKASRGVALEGAIPPLLPQA